MKRTEKEQLVSELKDKLVGAKSLYYTDFTGLNVKRMKELRRRLKRAGIDYVVIKNTLALRAVNESGLVGERLKGPTGLVFGTDPVAAAKVLTDSGKENEQGPSGKGGLHAGTAVDAALVKQPAPVPAREPRRRQGRHNSTPNRGPDPATPTRKRRAGSLFPPKAKRAVPQTRHKPLEADGRLVQRAPEPRGDAIDHLAADDGFADRRGLAPLGSILE